MPEEKKQVPAHVHICPGCATEFDCHCRHAADLNVQPCSACIVRVFGLNDLTPITTEGASQ